MTKIKHPSNRYERLQIKEKIKQFGTQSKDRTGHIRRRLARETEEVKELKDALITEQVLIEQERT